MDIFKNLGIKIKGIIETNKNRKTFFIAALGLLGIFLIFLSELIPEEQKQKEIVSSDIKFDYSENGKELESELETAISKIKGAGKTSVLITFDSSEEYFYASNSLEHREKKEYENELVIIEGTDGEKPVVLKKSEAKIRGVFVLCEGGENAVIREKIIEALCALLDISSNMVSVAEMA